MSGGLWGCEMRAAMAMMFVLCTAGLAVAQDNAMVAAIKKQHDAIKGNLVKSAAKVSSCKKNYSGWLPSMALPSAVLTVPGSFMFRKK